MDGPTEQDRAGTPMQRDAKAKLFTPRTTGILVWLYSAARSSHCDTSGSRIGLANVSDLFPRDLIEVINGCLSTTRYGSPVAPEKFIKRPKAPAFTDLMPSFGNIEVVVKDQGLTTDCVEPVPRLDALPSTFT